MRRTFIPLVVASMLAVAVPAAADGSVPSPSPASPDATTVVIVDLIDLDRPGDAQLLAELIDRAHEGVDATAALDGLDVMAATVTAEGRDALEASGLVESVREPRELRLLLDASTPRIEAAALHGGGLTGEGKVVAIIDSGIDADHPGLDGSVVAEACFLTGADSVPGATVRELCENTTTALTATGPGSAEPCTLLPSDCTHGTHVAGVVSGDDATLAGVAPDSGILSIRVGAVLSQNATDVNHIPELGVLEALEYVYEARDAYDIASVNLSLGGEAGACADATWEDVIGRLTDAGIAVVAASGNDGAFDSIAFPACLDDVVSAGASAGDGSVAAFTATSRSLDLLAPGEAIDSTVLAAYDPSGFAPFNGTSFSAPHVAAAFALVDHAHPGFGVERMRSLMRATGHMITRETPSPEDRDPRFPELRLQAIVDFEPFPDAGSGFWVSASDWAKHTGVSTGIFGLFQPGLELTRAQAVTFLWRFMGQPASSSPSGFADVSPDEWYADAVDWAAEQGVTTGVSPTVFAPEDPVSRGQLATFMWRTAGEPDAVATATFADVAPGAFYAEAVDWMAQNGITTGTSPTAFSPDLAVTRAQMVTFEHRLADAGDAWTGSVEPPALALF